MPSMYADLDVLLTDPDTFFAERDPTLAEAAIVVSALAVVTAASSLLVLAGGIGSMPTEFRGALVGGAVVGIAIGFVQTFVWWAILTGVFFVVTYFFGGEGSFGELLVFVGWGYVPQILGVLVALVLSTFTIPGSLALGLLFYLWSAYIWVFAIKRGRHVSVGEAVVAVAIPLGIVVILGGIGIVGMTGP